MSLVANLDSLTATAVSTSSGSDHSSAPLSVPSPKSDTQLQLVSFTKCPLCNETFSSPKVMPCCLRSFCQTCVEKMQDMPDRLKCHGCGQEVNVADGVNTLVTDYSIVNVMEQMATLDAASTNVNNSLSCTGCKSKDMAAVARCFDCANLLCPNCVMAHQFMHCFDGHRVSTLNEVSDKDLCLELRPVHCPKHSEEAIKFFCRTCDVLVCKECIVFEHPKGLHEHDYLPDATPKLVEQMTHLVDDGKAKITEFNVTLKTIEHITSRLHLQHTKAQTEVADTFNFYVSQIEELKTETLKELDDIYNSRLVSLSLLNAKVQDAIDKVTQISLFLDRFRKFSSSTELLFFKQIIEAKMRQIRNFDPEMNIPKADLEFISNYQAIQASVRNTFGYIRSSSSDSKQPPISRPNGLNSYSSRVNGFDSLLQKRFSSVNSTPNPTNSTANNRSFSTTSLTDSIVTLYEKWSIGGSGGSPDSGLFMNGTSSLSEQINAFSDPVIDLSAKIISASSMLPIKSQIKRQKMIYHCKFGEFGVMEGQFTEPSGVAVNAQNDIIVADTNNHRIQIFDKEGRFKFQFGECGKRDGQLLYPNRVAVVKQSGDIIVTERSPTHQIQIYNQYGQFVRKFGANILQHPRGVTVDNKGRIIVVECKVMRVLIFDQMGNVLQKFGCSKHLEFPNGVVVNDKQEIFISDNRAHCVKVFSYEGIFLRQIGGEGLTNYPIGVCINEAGEILVADNHNNFNITIFTQDGQLINALESKVKHAQCFDVALMDDNSVVLASKDYRIYIYRYLQLQSLAQAVASSSLC
ncbi:B-box type zinc finger protein ncl-1-like protein [Leptotrombidium deliense]|uniref:B-box type zinc finger protein ncl-1-like protein n=1 Tax=Leptotrombidium deliense TaxID=299467 RepID=A0A443SQ59_9ACAR|nr:B-box type zinc finger protein ncl-1-like protein [Leptotrombidium deliense]